MRLIAATALVFAACSSSSEAPGVPAHAATPTQANDAMTQKLAAPLEAELDAIRRDPVEVVGFGGKVYRPYEPNIGELLIGSDDPDVTARLLAEARGGGDRVYRLAVVHILGMRATADVDAALVALLGDREVGATAAYLLGRAGFKGYPTRTRDARAIVASLRAHLGDTTTFEDPFYRKRFQTRDFVLGAVVRLLDPETFHSTDDRVVEQIGYALPWWSDDVRADLLTQVGARAP
jgi:hypothetical protein